MWDALALLAMLVEQIIVHQCYSKIHLLYIVYSKLLTCDSYSVIKVIIDRYLCADNLLGWFSRLLNLT